MQKTHFWVASHYNACIHIVLWGFFFYLLFEIHYLGVLLVMTNLDLCRSNITLLLLFIDTLQYIESTISCRKILKKI